jgi:hypothetical protein
MPRRLTDEEKLMPYWTRYYQKNHREILAKKSVPHICECGGRYHYSGKAQHLRTQKHKNWVVARNVLEQEDPEDSPEDVLLWNSLESIETLRASQLAEQDRESLSGADQVNALDRCEQVVG